MVRPSRRAGSPIFRLRLNEKERGRRRKIMRRELVEQIGGEIRELVFDLELDSRGEKRRPFEQAADHRVDAVVEQSAQSLRDAGIFLSEFSRLFAQNGEFLIVEFEEFPVHRLQPIDLDLAGIEFDFGDEFHRKIYRLDAKLRADHEIVCATRRSSQCGPAAP